MVTVNSVTTPTITIIDPICPEGRSTLTSSSTIGNLWSTGETTQSIIVHYGEPYTVQQVIGTCTSDVSSEIMIPAYLPPPPPTISGNNYLCQGVTNTVLTSSSATNNLWNTGETTQSIIVLTGGNYTVSRVVGTCTSSTSATTVVTFNNIPPTPVILGNSNINICEGDGVKLYASEITGLAIEAYVWMNGITEITGFRSRFGANSAGTYTLRIVINGCTSAPSPPVVVTVNPVPATPPITASRVISANDDLIYICEGETVTFYGPTGLSNYLWNNGATTQSITVATSGSYRLSTSNEYGCKAYSRSIVVLVNPIPSTPTIIASGPTTFCSDDGVILSGPEITWNGQYQWYLNGNTIVSNEGRNQDISISQSGTYSLSVQIGDNCFSPQSNSITTTVTNCTPSSLIRSSSNNGISTEYKDIKTRQAQGKGNAEYGTASLVSIGTKYSMSLFPNPATDVLNFNIEGGILQTAAFKCMDATGRVVIDQEVTLQNNQGQIETALLNSGLYFIVAQSGDQVIRQSFVKK